MSGHAEFHTAGFIASIYDRQGPLQKAVSVVMMVATISFWNFGSPYTRSVSEIASTAKLVSYDYKETAKS